MTEFTASNGVEMFVHNTIIGQRLSVRDSDPAQIPEIGVRKDSIESYLDPRQVDALREFFQHESDKRPWDDADRGDVWLFHSEDDLGRALAWRANGDWDVVDQIGRFHPAVKDVPQEMRDHSFYGWDDPTAELIYRITKKEDS